MADHEVAQLGDDGVSALSEDLRLACMRISRRVRFESVDVIAPHQFSVLARLEDGPLTPRALADIEKVSAPSMTRTVGCLADEGLVERHDDPEDGRRVLVELTTAGREALTETRRRRDKWMTERVAELSGADQATLQAASAILRGIAAR
ncbi:MarR family transcriptional regulator [Janibacter sp. CX7]|uniref:MarR family winged helix-turn-helix transcriptional regulator n=1 Tax=Janibacter sp. CX7 TaxID=2963431 RepID=UPI0020CBF104|nr:MarR family transcriptional regulator [Janibacter sp. CX7]UTT66485.1 MarR family transcriptional regulator [Janibacter sp. CX7]